jgi:hypothetical protein
VIASLGLTFADHRVKSFDDKFQRLNYADERIIESLVRIRLAEKAFFSVNDRYTEDFDSLAFFLSSGHFYITSKVEIIHSIRPGVDSVETLIDTLDQVSVYDSLKNKLNLKKASLSTIGNLPDEEGLFDIYVNSRNGQHFIEVSDPKPINPRRKSNALEETALNPLKFGSKASPTTKGNWE